MCSATAAFRFYAAATVGPAHSVIAFTVPGRPRCALPYVSANTTEGSDVMIGIPGHLKSIAPRVISRYSTETCGRSAGRAIGDNRGCARCHAPIGEATTDAHSGWTVTNAVGSGEGSESIPLVAKMTAPARGAIRDG